MPSIVTTLRRRSGRSRTMWLSLLLVVVVAACDCARTGGGTPGSVTFMQLTDPHLFDAGKPRLPKQPLHDLVDIERTIDAFDWATDWPRDRRDLDFVVVTGDFGLEELPEYEVEVGVRYVAARLARLPVTTILLLPGNNDLEKEDPADIQRYRTFVDKLQRHLRGTTVVDLVQRSFEVKGARILGLDSASFKNTRCSSTLSPLPSGCVARFDYQKQEMKRLAERVGQGVGPPESPVHAHPGPEGRLREQPMGSEFPARSGTEVHVGFAGRRSPNLGSGDCFSSDPQGGLHRSFSFAPTPGLRRARSSPPSSGTRDGGATASPENDRGTATGQQVSATDRGHGARSSHWSHGRAGQCCVRYRLVELIHDSRLTSRGAPRALRRDEVFAEAALRRG
jgi:hypothetical protein